MSVFKQHGAIEVKRFYVYFESVCPKCGNEFDSEGNYVSYPDLDSVQEYGCYCTNCEHEWNVDIQLNLSVTVI